MIDKKLFALLGKDKKYVFFISVLSIIGMVANILTTGSLCSILYLISNRSDDIINYIIITIVIFFALMIKVIVTKIQNSFKTKLGARVKTDLREKIYRKITAIGGCVEDNESMSGITQIAVDGIEQLDLYYTTYLPQLFYAMISPMLLFSICVAIDYRTALVLLLCVPIIPIAIICVSKYAKKIFNKYWNQYITMGDKFLDNLQGMQELKIFNADSKAQVIMDQRSEEFRKITMKVLVMQLMSITIMDIVAFGGAGLGIAMALMSGVGTGLNAMLVLFLLLISAEFFLPMRALGSAFHIAMNGASAGKRIIKLLELEEPTWGNCICSGGDIKLESVDFGYTEECKVLSNVSMQFKQKTFSAIVGESGCGKSTIVSLIIGKLFPNSGKVVVGDNEINNYVRQSYYSKIALVSHNTFIFGMTVRENFYLAKKDASDKEIYNALNKVNLQHLFAKDEGLDILISESASNISGGERQRLALAINLLANKDIYIFDEATSNIDIESETIIMDNIRDLSKEKTVILISHRLANAALADNIFVLNGGVIVESGNHQELINNCGHYNFLFKAQLKLENAYKEA